MSTKKGVGEKLRRLGFHTVAWGSTFAFIKGGRTAKEENRAVGIVKRRKKRQWYVGHIFMTDGTPAALETLVGPFDRWREAVACYNVTAGVK